MRAGLIPAFLRAWRAAMPRCLSMGREDDGTVPGTLRSANHTACAVSVTPE
jgi:hypothetical protein